MREVYDILLAMGKIYNENLDELRVSAYCKILKDYDKQDVLRAIKQSVKEYDRYPAVSQIIKIIERKKQVDPTDEANEIAGVIIEAIGKFGWAQESVAKEQLGNDIWHVVQRFGGWSSLCSIECDDLSTVRAQLRGLAHSMIAYRKSMQDGFIPKSNYQIETSKRLRLDSVLNNYENELIVK